MKQRLQALLLALLLTASLTLAGCAGLFQPEVDLGSVSISDFQGNNPWVELDGNQPAFTDQEKGTPSPLRTTPPWMPWAGAGWRMPTSAPSSCPPRSGGRSAR